MVPVSLNVTSVMRYTHIHDKVRNEYRLLFKGFEGGHLFGQLSVNVSTYSTDCDIFDVGVSMYLLSCIARQAVIQWV